MTNPAYNVPAIAFLPGDPPTPAPQLLTEEEAIRYLRLDTVNVDDPAATLRRYRERGLLRGTQVSRRIPEKRCEHRKSDPDRRGYGRC